MFKECGVVVCLPLTEHMQADTAFQVSGSVSHERLDASYNVSVLLLPQCLLFRFCSFKLVYSIRGRDSLNAPP